MVGTEFALPTDVDEKPQTGPRCATCGKPYRLTPEKGGCKCERHPSGAEVTPTRLIAADRQAVALEGILEALVRIERRMGSK